MANRNAEMRAYAVMFTEYPDVVGVREVMRMLGVGRNKAYALVQQGELKRLPYPNAIKVPKLEVIRYVLRHTR